MATPLPSLFSKSLLTPREEFEATILNAGQKLLFQNLLCETAEQKLVETLDPASPLPFIQQEAYLRGKMEFIQWILSASDAAELELARLAALSSPVN